MNQKRSIVARARGQAVKTKTAGMPPLLLLPHLFPQRDAGGKGWLDNKARKSASGNRGITAFFGEPNALLSGHGIPVPEGTSFDESEPFYRCPGMETLGQKENILFPESIENTPFSKIKLLFSQRNWK